MFKALQLFSNTKLKFQFIKKLARFENLDKSYGIVWINSKNLAGYPDDEQCIGAVEL